MPTPKEYLENFLEPSPEISAGEALVYIFTTCADLGLPFVFGYDPQFKLERDEQGENTATEGAGGYSIAVANVAERDDEDQALIFPEFEAAVISGLGALRYVLEQIVSSEEDTVPNSVAG